MNNLQITFLEKLIYNFKKFSWKKDQPCRFSDATNYWKWNLFRREPGWKFVQILVEIEKIKETDKFLQAAKGAVD